MEHFIDDPLDLVGISNSALGIDKPVLIFKHLFNAKEFISSHPLKDNCFYSISILTFYETCT